MEQDAITALFLDRALAKSRALVHFPLFSRFLVQCSAINRARFAGSVSCFTSIAINRVDLRVVQSCGRSIGSVSNSSKRRHMACCCVCSQVNETGHAQRLNVLKQRPRKWFFREEVNFLLSLAFVVQLCSHTIAIYRKCFCG